MTAREALAEQWRERFEDFADAEMTVGEWCDFNRVSVSQYYYWRKRLASLAAEPEGNGPWLAIDIVNARPATAVSSGVTVRVAGAEIPVAVGFDPALLRAVVSALATPTC